MESVMFAESLETFLLMWPKPQHSVHTPNMTHDSLKIRTGFSHSAIIFLTTFQFGRHMWPAWETFFSLVPAYFGNTQCMTKEFTPIRGGDILHAMLKIQKMFSNSCYSVY